MSPERLSIIGTGAMGKNHARTAHGLREFRLSQIVDADELRAEAVAADYGNAETRVSSSIDTIDKTNTDAAIIAVPSHLHAEISTELMEKGIHVLVEKPIAMSTEDASDMLRVSEENGVTLMVGHIELFNPVVKELRKLLASTAIKSMRFKRLGYVDDVSRLYHDVVGDLMIHDVAIADVIMDPKKELSPEVVSAFGRYDGTSFANTAEAAIDYTNGVDVQFRASRSFKGGKVRKVEVETDEGVFDADLISKAIVRRSGGEGAISTNGTYVQDLRASSYFAQDSRQPLELEQIHFLKSIKGETTPSVANVAADDAIRTLELVQSIVKKLRMIKSS